MRFCELKFPSLAAVTTADQIMDIARSLSANVVNTVKLVNQRIAILIDPILKRRLETANEITKNSIQNLVRAMGEVPILSSAKVCLLALQALSLYLQTNKQLMTSTQVVKRPSDATARAEQRRISREVENVRAARIPPWEEGVAYRTAMIFPDTGVRRDNRGDAFVVQNHVPRRRP